MFSTRRAGTGFAFGVALMWAVSASCVLPPPGEELPEIENRPPRIDKDNLSPGPTSPPVRVNPACTPRFDATVSDPDADTLYYRVFVDYFQARENKPAITEVPLNVTTRIADVSFRLNDAHLSSTDRGSIHTVELFLADRPFRDGPDPQGRRIEDDEPFDSYVWPIVIDPDLDCAGVP